MSRRQRLAPTVSDAFFERLARAPAGVLMLDYDGTLAPFREDPAQAVPYPGVREALARLRDDPGTRLVIVTGRWLESLIPLLSVDPLPELWGSHGRERRLPDGRTQLAALDPAATQALARADDWAPVLKALGARIERKPGSLAVHWRARPHARAAIEAALRERLRLELPPDALEWLPFDGGVELRAPGCDKGDAVRTLAAEAPPGTLMAYLGDDLTDEDAFAALREDDLGVLVRPTPRPTRAHVHLRPPHELLAFLARWADRALRPG
jgi:trehalose 6-phosphate phosphatase